MFKGILPYIKSTILKKENIIDYKLIIDTDFYTKYMHENDIYMYIKKCNNSEINKYFIDFINKIKDFDLTISQGCEFDIFLIKPSFKNIEIDDKLHNTLHINHNYNQFINIFNLPFITFKMLLCNLDKKITILENYGFTNLVIDINTLFYDNKFDVKIIPILNNTDNIINYNYVIKKIMSYLLINENIINKSLISYLFNVEEINRSFLQSDIKINFNNLFNNISLITNIDVYTYYNCYYLNKGSFATIYKIKNTNKVLRVDNVIDTDMFINSYVNLLSKIPLNYLNYFSLYENIYNIKSLKIDGNKSYKNALTYEMTFYQYCLYDYIKNDYLTTCEEIRINTIKKIINQLISIIKMCQSNNIILGDLKTTNIMINLNDKHEFLNVVLIDYIYEIYDNNHYLTCTYPGPEGLPFYNYEEDSINFDSIKNYNYTYDNFGLFNVIFELFTKKSLYTYFLNDIVIKNNILNINLFYSLVYFILDDNQDREINNYNFNVFLNIFNNIESKSDFIELINTVPILFQKNELVLTINKVFCYKNLITKQHIINYFIDNVQFNCFKYFNKDDFFVSLFNLIKFNFEKRNIDFTNVFK